MQLQSLHQIEHYVNVRLPQVGIREDELQVIMAQVAAVHFYVGKVKYDLIIQLSTGGSTKIYNVDSCYVFSNVDGSHEEDETETKDAQKRAEAVLAFIQESLDAEIIDEKTAKALEDYYASI